MLLNMKLLKPRLQAQLQPSVTDFICAIPTLTEL